MSKISVVYWSQSGNTAAMAEAVAKGVTDAGKEAEIVFVSSASIDELKSETAFALLKYLCTHCRTSECECCL